MKKILLLCLALCSLTLCFATKVKRGTFDILENELFCGVQVDFSQAKFDKRSLETHLSAYDISKNDWNDFETACALMVSSAFNSVTREDIRLCLKSSKKTNYYILIQPKEIDLDDGECDIDITLKDAKGNDVVAFATSDSKAKDTKFWEYNILQSMINVGLEVLEDLLDF